MKKLLLTTEEWLHIKWILERNMIRIDADAFRLKEGEPGSEASREAIGKELESIEKERRERLREEAEARKAILRILKGMCLWTSGAAMILSAMAGMAEMTYECVLTGLVALAALLYGLA